MESRSAATSHPAIPRILQRAADALADAAWVMEGAKTDPPLPPPITLVLPQTRRVEAELRDVLREIKEGW